MNILILSAGRRVELVKCFQKAAKELNIKSKIITADLSNTAPASFFANKNYKVPRVVDKEYINSIIEISNKEDVKLIVPTIDTELLVLAENKKIIEEKTQARVLISDLEVIKVCRNKKESNKFFEENSFGVPKEITNEDIKKGNYEFPLFIKPLDGSSSINTFKVNNKKELEFFMDYIDKPIIQNFIEGTEYTVDVFIDFDGKLISTVPRERMATRGGEISKGKIVRNTKVINEVNKVIEILKPIGHITVQCMDTLDGIKFIEINPRFGGGAPMSIKAGADSPKNLYRLLCGEKLEKENDFKENMMALRFDDAIFIDEKGELI